MRGHVVARQRHEFAGTNDVEEGFSGTKRDRFAGIREAVISGVQQRDATFDFTTRSKAIPE